MTTSIMLQHLSGSKANQIQQFPLDALQEITLGREANCTVSFDPLRDDTVSRQHAVIKVRQGDPPTFTITDLGSANGTRINGNPVSGNHDLLVGDTVELGSGGPKFIFDLQPRPPSMIGRTRVIDMAPAGATRILNATAQTATGVSPGRSTTDSSKPGIGRDTVMHILSNQRHETEELLRSHRQTASRVWMGIAAAILVVCCAGGAGLFYVTHRTASQFETVKQDLQTTVAGVSASVAATVDAGIAKKLGLNSEQVAQRIAAATVFIQYQWHVYDAMTGKPLFHRQLTQNGQKLPCFIELADHKIVPWLAADDEGLTNQSIGEAGKATGFVISEQGYILTNKHVAAAWLRPRDMIGGSGEIAVYQIQGSTTSDLPPKKIKLNELSNSDRFKHWVLQEGGWIFNAKHPVRANSGLGSIVGRDDMLEVRFPKNLAGTSGRLVRAAPDADVALIKVDTQQPLTWAELAEDDNVKVGQRVIVLGYPEFTHENYQPVKMNEVGRDPVGITFYPDPTVTEGIISHIGKGGDREAADASTPNVRPTYSADRDLYQMTVPTGRGNSGGPVIDTSGKVIGIFSYITEEHESVTYASPIRHGIALKTVQ